MTASKGELQPQPDVVVVVLESTTLLEELKLWCDGCCLPAGYHAVYLCAVDGQALGVVELRGCIECDP